MKVASILDTIGNTPHIAIQRLFGSSHQVWIKSERSNPGGSIKDRIALAMILDAEKRGVLQAGGTIADLIDYAGAIAVGGDFGVAVAATRRAGAGFHIRGVDAAKCDAYAHFAGGSLWLGPLDDF